MPLVLPHGQPGVSDQTEFESENFAVFFLFKNISLGFGTKKKMNKFKQLFPKLNKSILQKKKPKNSFIELEKFNPPKILLCSPILEHEKF